MINDIYNILTTIHKDINKPFSGLGLLICDDVKDIPIYPLYNSDFEFSSSIVTEQLKELSSLNSTHHDGFHVLSPKLVLTHVAQYFYPTPIQGQSLNANKNYGARYFVAQAGSMLPNVMYSAVVGNNYDICIFSDGKQVMAE